LTLRDFALDPLDPLFDAFPVPIAYKLLKVLGTFLAHPRLVDFVAIVLDCPSQLQRIQGLKLRYRSHQHIKV
jgi:hypothetical protein